MRINGSTSLVLETWMGPEGVLSSSPAENRNPSCTSRLQPSLAPAMSSAAWIVGNKGTDAIPKMRVMRCLVHVNALPLMPLSSGSLPLAS